MPCTERSYKGADFWGYSDNGSTGPLQGSSPGSTPGISTKKFKGSFTYNGL